MKNVCSVNEKQGKFRAKGSRKSSVINGPHQPKIKVNGLGLYVKMGFHQPPLLNTHDVLPRRTGILNSAKFLELKHQASTFPIPPMEIASSTSKAETTDPDASPSPRHIFILSGQSNMAGRGGVTRERVWDGVVPQQCRPNTAISRLSAALRWEPAREPLHQDIDRKRACGVGPGMAFANAVVRRCGAGSESVGLVPCAVGGTAIKEWARGEHLYENMVRRARASMQGSAGAGDRDGGGEIKALLWYQGESDTGTQQDAEAYQANMERLIHNVREDLGLPSLPIIQVAIASGDSMYIERVREAQLRIDLPNVICVDAKGLPLKEDHIHLTAEAQVRLGLMLADAYLKNFVPE